MRVPKGYTLTQVIAIDGEFSLARGHRHHDGKPLLFLSPSRPSPNPASLERMTHEYGLRDEIHPGWAAQALELNQTDGACTLLLADPGGESLGQLLGRPMEATLLLRLAIGICSAVGRLHKKEIVHKNINPNHILVNVETGAAHLLGFGIASRIPREKPDLPALEQIVGSFPYMAPEQTGRMNRSVDSRSDLYALGVIFYEMLTGVPPFSAEEPMEWVCCHVARQAIPPVERVPGILPQLSALVMKLLAKTAEARYQTAGGVQADLQQCLVQWTTKGGINPFALAGKDFSGYLAIPEKLYGRERQRGILLGACQRVLQGGKEMVLISGESGVGKTTLANEVHQAIMHTRTLFANGKFESCQYHAPYATLAQACQSLVRQRLLLGDESLGAWREAILQAVGKNGQLILNLIPELKAVIGPQAAPVALDAADAQNRFHAVFMRFFGTFTNGVHALVLFLDDMQWIDPASLSLLEHIVTHMGLNNFLLIGAYRNNEVSQTHPLMLTTNAIKGNAICVHEIALAGLSMRHVSDLFADTLHCDGSDSAPLVELVFDKTAGNPFFTIQYLQHLTQERLLCFDQNLVRWSWDLHQIRYNCAPDNVAQLMVSCLERLPMETLEAMKSFACLGVRAKAKPIAMVCDCSEETLHRQFWYAVRLGLLVRNGEEYQFGHDLMHQVVYSLFDKALLPTLHLKIARLLSGEMTKTGVDDELFNIVNHFNLAIDLVISSAERQYLCHLNSLAGNKAKAAIAYVTAHYYLMREASLSPSDSWRDNYRHTFDLHLALSECAYLSGDFETADTSFKLAFAQANCDPDRAEMAISRAAVCQTKDDFAGALRILLDALCLLGVRFDESDEEIDLALESERAAFAQALNGRSVGELVDLPETQDPKARMLIELLAGAMIACYISHPRLLALLMLRGVNISVRNGNCAASSMVYCGYSLRLAAKADAALAYEFSELALRVSQKFNDGKRRGKLLYLHGCFIHVWRKSIATCIPYVEGAFIASQEAGDTFISGYCTYAIPYIYFQRNAPLEEIQKVCHRYVATIKPDKNQPLIQAVRVLEQTMVCLMGLTVDECSFDDDTFSEAEALALFTKADLAFVTVSYYILKQVVAFTLGNYALAQESADSAVLLTSFIAGNLYEVNHYFFHALTLTALYPQASCEQQQEYRKILTVQLKKLQFWADNCPENFHGLYTLVLAETSRIEGQAVDAMGWYDMAIASAREHGFLHYEGIANELAAGHFMALGRKTAAAVYFRNSRICYLRWGAMGKVRQLDRRFPELATRIERRSNSGSQLEYLDLLSVIKASHAVSGDIVLDHLIKQLLTIVVEHAGANRGLLILPEAGQMRIAAEASADGRQISVAIKPAAEANAMPQMIVNYVLRAKIKVLLDDASIHNPYSDDIYLQSRQPKSVLCIPLVKQAELVGVVYLENSLAPGVFTDERIALIELLASQAAISLENAILFNNLEREQSTIRELNASLEQRVTERTAELQRAVREQQMALAQLIQQEKMASLGTLTAGIAHEINNPANFAHVGAQALGLDLERFRRFLLDLAEGSEEEVLLSLNQHINGLAHQLDAINEGTTRIKNLVLDLRTFSRLDEAEWKSVAIADSLRATINLVRTRYQKIAEIRCDLDANPIVECWPTQLNQVFMNLVVNACQAIQARPKSISESIPGLLQIRGYIDGASLVLEFEDNGCGMSQTTMNHIFDPFFTTKTVGEGMGMGLSIAFGIIEKHRGTISMVSKEGEGSCFTLKLPLRG